MFDLFTQMQRRLFQEYRDERIRHRFRLRGKPRVTVPFTERERIARSMTNWQNSQWLRAWAKQADLEKFANLRRS